MNHIKLLKAFESTSHTTLMWDRINQNTIWVSTYGYKTAEQSSIEEALVKSGCRYNFKHPHGFDRTNGRTTVFFTEPGGK